MEKRRRKRSDSQESPNQLNNPNERPEGAQAAQQQEPAPVQVTRMARGPSREGWGVVIHDLRRIDPAADYVALREKLVLADHCDDYATVLRLADEAPDLMVRAVQYVRRARLDEAEVLEEVESRLHVLREQVREAFAKELGARPSADRVDAVVRQEYGDEYQALRRRKDEMHAAVRVAEGLAEAWKAKTRLIDTMLGKVAK